MELSISIVRITLCGIFFAALSAISVPVKAQSSSEQGVQPSPARERKPPQKEDDALRDYLAREPSVRYPPRVLMRGGVEPSTNSHLSKAETEYRAGRNAAAVPELKQAVKESPDSYASHYLLALTLTETGELKEAIEEFKKAIALATKDDSKIVANYNMGNAYFDLRDYQNAVDAYRSSLKVDETLSKIHNNLGLALIGLKRTSEAAAEFKRAVELKPTYAESQYNLGVAYLQVGKKSEAEEVARALAGINADLAEKLKRLIDQ